jgi:hypothetical protein
MDDRIVLYKSVEAKCWMARFEGPCSEEIKLVFETDTLPTPFTLQAEPEDVRRELQQRNPQIDVVIEPEGGQ